MQIAIDDRTVKATFRRHNTDAPELMRIYYLCNQAFYKKSGVFTLEQLVQLLSEKGYKSLRPGSGGNRQKKITELRELLLSAPELFIQSKPDIFRTVSKHRIHRLKTSERLIDDSLLNKDNKREFYDLIIGIPADGRTVDYKTSSKTTGYTKARVCQAARANHEKGHILKVNNEITLGKYENKLIAQIEKIKLFKNNKVIAHIRAKSEIVKKDRFDPTKKPVFKTFYHIVVFGANSYTSDIMLNPDNGKPQPIISEKHESTVCNMIRQFGKRTLNTFKSDSHLVDYVFRCCNV